MLHLPPAVLTFGGAEEATQGVVASPDGRYVAVWTSSHLHICSASSVHLDSLARLELKVDDPAGLASVVWRPSSSVAIGADVVHNLAILSGSQLIMVQFVEVIARTATTIQWLLGEAEEDADRTGQAPPSVHSPHAFRLTQLASVSAASDGLFTAAAATPCGVVAGQSDGTVCIFDWAGLTTWQEPLRALLSEASEHGSGYTPTGRETLAHAAWCGDNHDLALGGPHHVLMVLSNGAVLSAAVGPRDASEGEGVAGAVVIRSSSLALVSPLSAVTCIAAAVVRGPCGGGLGEASSLRLVAAVGRADGSATIFSGTAAHAGAAGRRGDKQHPLTLACPPVSWRTEVHIASPGGSGDGNGGREHAAEGGGLTSPAAPGRLRLRSGSADYVAGHEECEESNGHRAWLASPLRAALDEAAGEGMPAGEHDAPAPASPSRYGQGLPGGAGPAVIGLAWRHTHGAADCGRVAPAPAPGVTSCELALLTARRHVRLVRVCLTAHSNSASFGDVDDYDPADESDVSTAAVLSAALLPAQGGAPFVNGSSGGSLPAMAAQHHGSLLAWCHGGYALVVGLVRGVTAPHHLAAPSRGAPGAADSDGNDEEDEDDRWEDSEGDAGEGAGRRRGAAGRVGHLARFGVADAVSPVGGASLPLGLLRSGSGSTCEGGAYLLGSSSVTLLMPPPTSPREAYGGDQWEGGARYQSVPGTPSTARGGGFTPRKPASQAAGSGYGSRSGTPRGPAVVTARHRPPRQPPSGSPAGGDDPASETQQSLAWAVLPVSQHYVPANAPLRLACASPDGSALAVAGHRGLAVWVGRSRRWHVFPTPSQEARVAPACLAWLGRRTLLLLHAALRGAPAAANGSASGSVGDANEYELQAYPASQLDSEAQLGALKLTLPPGASPCGMTAGSTTVTLPPSPGSASSGPTGDAAVSRGGTHWVSITYALPGGDTHIATFRLALGSGEGDAPEGHGDLRLSADPRRTPALRVTAPLQPFAPRPRGDADGGPAAGCVPRTTAFQAPLGRAVSGSGESDESDADAGLCIDDSGESEYRQLTLTHRAPPTIQPVPVRPIASLMPQLVSVVALPVGWASAHGGVASVSCAGGETALPSSPLSAEVSWADLQPQLIVTSASGSVWAACLAGHTLTRLAVGPQRVEGCMTHPMTTWGGPGHACASLVLTRVASYVYAPAVRDWAPASDPRGGDSDDGGDSEQGRKKVAAPAAVPGLLVPCRPLQLGTTGPCQLLGLAPQHGGALVVAHAGASLPPHTQGAGEGDTGDEDGSARRRARRRKQQRRHAPSPGLARALPPGIRLIPTLHLILRAAAVAGIYGPPAPPSPSTAAWGSEDAGIVGGGGAFAPPSLSLSAFASGASPLSPLSPQGGALEPDPLACAVSLASACLRSLAPTLAQASLRALLHDAVEDEAEAKGAWAAATPPADGVLRDRLARVRAAAAGAPGGLPAGSPTVLSPAATAVAALASPHPTASVVVLVDGCAAVPLTDAMGPGALALLRTLAGATREHLSTKRIPPAAVFGEAPVLEGLLPPSLASPPAGAAGLLAAEGTPARAHAPPPVPPPRCSPLLSAVVALLRGCDVHLDVIGDVGRTIEEERLPHLFPHAGEPRALFREALRRAATASGSVSASPQHCAASLRFLRSASALLLLVQEHAYRRHCELVDRLTREARDRTSGGGGGGWDDDGVGSKRRPRSSGAGAVRPSPGVILRIVNQNLEDAGELLGACGLPHAAAEAMVGERLGIALHHQADHRRGRAHSAGGAGSVPESGAAGSHSSSGFGGGDLDALIATSLAAAAGLPPGADGSGSATLAGLHTLVGSVLAYCGRLRCAAQELADGEGGVAAALASTGTHALRLRASSAASSGPTGGGDAPASASDGSSGSGGGGLISSVLSLFGLGGGAPAAQQPSSSGVDAGGSSSSSAAAAASRAWVDPVVELLSHCTLQLLVEGETTLHRRPGDGSFGLILAPVDHRQAVRGAGRGPPSSLAAAAAPLPSGGGGGKGAPLPEDDDIATVTAATGELVHRQHEWLGAQILDAAACVSGLAPHPHGTVAGPAAAASPAGGGGGGGLCVAVGDILTRVEGAPVTGLPFHAAVGALASAPRDARLRVARVVDVPLLHLLPHFMSTDREARVPVRR